MERPPPEAENSIDIEELDDYLPGFDESYPKPVPKKEPLFFRTFVNTPGCLRFLLTAFFIGFTTGMCHVMIPEVLSDRYARLNHGYTGEPCYELNNTHKPKECNDGFGDAQTVHVWSHFGKNMLNFCFSTVVGSLSDTTGRRQFYLVSIFLPILPQLALVLILLIKSMDPVWFYLSFACTGFVNWLPITFASLSDVLPGRLRAPGYALILASFCTASAVVPYFATLFPYNLASIIGLVAAISTFLYATLFVQETLSYEMSAVSEVVRRRSNNVGWFFLRPFRDISILKRSRLLLILSVVSFITAVTCATDGTFVIYYIENHLGFKDRETALFFLFLSGSGILVNTLLLKQFVKCLGEKHVLIMALMSGITYNFLYGIAKSKVLFLASACLTSIDGLSYPIIASIQSYNCADHEQGQIQGAFFSLRSFSSAVSPFLMLRIYKATEHNKGFFGAGTFFLVVSFMNIIGLFFALILPRGDTNSEKKSQVTTDLNQLLLEDSEPENDSASVDSRVEFF